MLNVITNKQKDKTSEQKLNIHKKHNIPNPINIYHKNKDL